MKKLGYNYNPNPNRLFEINIVGRFIITCYKLGILKRSTAQNFIDIHAAPK